MYAMVFDLIMLLMPVIRSILFLYISFYTFECKNGIKTLFIKKSLGLKRKKLSFYGNKKVINYREIMV
jgi:hypothetical protein